MCDVFMSNLNIILAKVDELSQIREQVDKIKSRSGPGLIGDILDTSYVKDLLKDLDSQAKSKIEEFRQLKHEKEQEMQEDYLEGEDENAMDTILNAEKEAECIVKDIEVLLSPNRQVPQPAVGDRSEESEAGVVGDKDAQGVAAGGHSETVVVADVHVPASPRTSSVEVARDPEQAAGTSSNRVKKPQCPREAIQ